MEQHIAVYLRVSLEDISLGEKQRIKEEQESSLNQESNSIFAQRKLIEKYIAQEESLRGLPFSEFVDDGFTGTNFERPAFQQMMEKIKAGMISCVSVKDLSRFGRNYLEVGDYLEHLFPFLGIRFSAVNDGYDSQEHSGANAGIDIAFKNILHDYYSRDLSVKIRSAQQSRMRTGKYVNVPPYGYRRDPEDKHHLLPDPATASIVKRIFQMVIDGNSTSQVAAILNQEGIPTPLQAKGIRRKKGILCEKPLMWSHAAILNILGNYKYTGAMVNHSCENPSLRARSQIRVPQTEWIVHEGMHEALVSHEEFQLAKQAIRKVENYSQKKRDFSKSVYYCGYCGRRLRKTYGKTTYLSCQTVMYQKDAECGEIRWILPEMEEMLLDSFQIQLCFLKKLRKKQKTKKKDPGKMFIRKIEEIKAQVDFCNSRKMQLYMEYRGGQLSRDSFIMQKEEQTKEEKRLKVLLEETQADYEQHLEERQKEKEQEELLNQYAPEGEFSKEELLQLMYQGIDRVIVYKEQLLEVIWKFQDVFAEEVEEKDKYEVRNRHKAEDGKEEEAVNEAVNEKAIIAEKRMA